MAGQEGLERFVDAQEWDYEQAIAELRAGRKRSHWIWYVLPQARGLGMSHMSWHYGIASLEEARAYLAHPVLGPRLKETCEALLALPTNDAYEVMGHPDDLKLRSSMSLFDAVAGERNSVFARVLNKYFDGVPDRRTLEIIESWA